MNKVDLYAKEYPEFITVTCLEWKYVLKDNRFKDIIMESLGFLSVQRRVVVHAFVMMSNHFHFILANVRRK
jgi:REP element-mobilizing transposase RayT